MTKAGFVKVISVFFTLTLFLWVSPFSVGASPSSIATLLKKNQTQPPIGSSLSETKEKQTEAERKERVQKLLQALDKWYQKIKEDRNSNLSPTPTPERDLYSLASLHTSDINSYLGKPKPIVVLLSQKKYEKESMPPNYIPISELLLSVSENNAYSNQQVNANTKNNYTIAFLGDSMTDTLGEALPDMQRLLKAEHPNKTFTLLNYGQGGTNLEDGIERLIHQTTYLERTYPPLLDYKPDILVVESFAYNHWGGQKSDLDRHWLGLAKIIDTIKLVSPQTQVVLAATISPNYDIFGNGVLNWPKELKYQSTLITKAYLQNLINFAVSQGLPLADAYHPSMDEHGQGQPKYINKGDNLHPSDEGKFLFSQKVLEAFKNYNLIR